MKKTDYTQIVALTLSLGVAVYYVFTLVYYGFVAGYLDHVEPNMALMSWGLLHGEPVYKPVDSPDLLFSAYGPVHYILQAAVFWVFGGSIALSKAMMLSASGLALALFGVYAWKRFGLLFVPLAVIGLAALLMKAAPTNLWNRTDVLMVFLTTAAVCAVGHGEQGRTGRLGIWVIGVSIGLCANLKIYTPIYFLPVMAMLWLERDGWRDRFVVLVHLGLVSTVVMVLPFLMPQISAVDYVTNLFQLAGARERDLSAVVQIGRASLLYLAPGLILLVQAVFGNLRRKDLILYAALVVSTVAVFYPATMPGAGGHHLLPLAPMSVILLVIFSRGMADAKPAMRMAYFLIPLAILVLSVPNQKRLYRNFAKNDRPDVVNEIKAVMAAHRGETVEMGYGQSLETYRLSFFRPLLAFAGNPITVDAMTLMELRKSRVPIPPSMADPLRACKTSHWLIPKGEKPFHLKNYYAAFGTDAGSRALLFDDGFREAFLDTYRLSESREFFDVWSCGQK
jgi:4-amino-4-deoxy-L-arabinose transferase-like glycosyltransferase